MSNEKGSTNQQPLTVTPDDTIDERSMDGPAYIRLPVAFKQYLRELKGPTLSVFICLAVHADEHGWSEPSIETIMRETGYAESDVHRGVARLRELIAE